MIPFFCKKYSSGGGGTALYTYIGTNTANGVASVSLPAGWAVGDLLVGYDTGGSGVPTTPTAGWTQISSGTTNGGFVAYKIAASVDTAFSAGASSGYYAVSVFRKTSGSPVLDTSSINKYTASATIVAPTLASSTSGELFFVVFGSADAALHSPDPAATSGTDTFLYTVNGFGGSGLVGNYTLTTTSGSFGGQTCGASAASAYPAASVSMLFK